MISVSLESSLSWSFIIFVIVSSVVEVHVLDTCVCRTSFLGILFAIPSNSLFCVLVLYLGLLVVLHLDLGLLLLLGSYLWRLRVLGCSECFHPFLLLCLELLQFPRA